MYRYLKILFLPLCGLIFLGTSQIASALTYKCVGYNQVYNVTFAVTAPTKSAAVTKAINTFQAKAYSRSCDPTTKTSWSGNNFSVQISLYCTFGADGPSAILPLKCTYQKPN